MRRKTVASRAECGFALTMRADAGSPGATKMHDIPLTLADALFACAFGLALGALVALGL